MDVELVGVTRRHEDGTVALRAVSLAVPSGSALAVTGPSGCGKTTLLRAVAGLDPLQGGAVRIGGRDVTATPPRERDVALLTQEHNLLNHLTVEGNLALPLRLRRRPAAEIRDRVLAEARAGRLARLLDRLPATLSGGTRQRAALARSMTRTPRVLLLDEPFSALDPDARGRARAEVTRTRRGAGITTLVATNEQADAFALAESILVLRAGSVVQTGPTAELLTRPADRFVAGFVGTDPMRFLEATPVTEPDLWWLRVGEQRLRMPAALPGALRRWLGRPLLAGLRSAALRPSALDPGAPVDRRLRGRLRWVEHLGSEDRWHVDVAGDTVVARTPPATPATVNDDVELQVDGDRIHLFDPTDGLAVWHGRPST